MLHLIVLIYFSEGVGTYICKVPKTSVVELPDNHNTDSSEINQLLGTKIIISSK